MEFFVDNWSWFLGGAVVLLMTLIGYIAEQTDFGRKEVQKQEKPKKIKEKKVKEKKVKEKKQKKSKENQETEVLEMEQPKPEIQMALATDTIFDEPVMTENFEEVQELNVPLEEINTEHTDTVESYPVEELNDFMQEEVYTEPVVQENMTYQMPEELNETFEDITFDTPSVEEDVVSEPREELVLNDVNNFNVELPDLDTTISEEDDSDDVWKF